MNKNKTSPSQFSMKNRGEVKAKGQHLFQGLYYMYVCTVSNGCHVFTHDRVGVSVFEH